MPTITIDEQSIDVPVGETVLTAARRLGIEIPTLCHLEGFESGASCMVCAVRMKHNGQFIPACASRVVDGMELESNSEEVRETRRMALELLFSDHLGDCLSPCQRICPAHLGIPAVLKHVREGNMGLAAGAVRHDLALAGILCRICQRPCESGCRRGDHDDAVAIAELVSHVVDCERGSGSPRVAPVAAERGGSVAIVGAGFTGLSAAWFLRQQGFGCTVLEVRSEVALGVAEAYPDLDPGLLVAEIELLRACGIEFRCGEERIDGSGLDALAEEFPAVLLAVGGIDSSSLTSLGLGMKGERLLADSESMMTTRDGVFAAGKVVRAVNAAVTSVAEGKAAARCIHQYLEGERMLRPPKPFSCHIGKLDGDEMGEFLKLSGKQGSRADETIEIAQAIEESQRCVRCNCAKIDSCKLRDLAIEYQAKQNRFPKGERASFQRNTEHPLVVFEAGKCIRCGNCIKVAGDYQEQLGLTFIGRGFDVHVGVPFEGSMEEGLRDAAKAVVAACPVGALALKDSW